MRTGICPYVAKHRPRVERLQADPGRKSVPINAAAFALVRMQVAWLRGYDDRYLAAQKDFVTIMNQLGVSL